MLITEEDVQKMLEETNDEEWTEEDEMEYLESEYGKEMIECLKQLEYDPEINESNLNNVRDSYLGCAEDRESFGNYYHDMSESILGSYPNFSKDILQTIEMYFDYEAMCRDWILSGAIVEIEYDGMFYYFDNHNLNIE